MIRANDFRKNGFIMIATFLKLNSWSPGAGFYPIVPYNVLRYRRELNLYRKNVNFSTQLTVIRIFKKWVQF